MTAKYHVLHVDDDPGFAELTASFLETEQEDFAVTSVSDPNEALDALANTSEEFDCIVSDYQMPQMTGLELLDAIYTQDPDFGLPFILLTGQGSEEIAADALNRGATSYIQKGGTDVYEYLAQRIRHDIQQAVARRNSQRFATLVEAIDDPVYVLNEEGVFQYINEAFCSLTGYTEAEVLGSTPDLIKDESAVATGEEYLRQILSADGPDNIQFEVEIHPNEGDPIPCEDRMSVLPYEGTTFQGSLGVLRDISQRQEREEALAEARNRYQLLVEQSLVGLYIAQDTELLYHNSQFACIFNYPERENALSGESILDLVQPDDRERLSENLHRVKTDMRDSLREPFVGQAADGSSVHVELLVRDITLDNQPATIGTVVLAKDSMDTYWQIRRERDRLEQFTSIVSHDLKAPLSVAYGQLQLAQGNEAIPDEAASSLAEAEQALDRMDELLTDLLELARQGEIVENPESIDVAQLANTAWHNIATDEATLSVPASGAIDGDRSRVKGLFENLYRNAIEHSGSDVTVEVGNLDSESDEHYGFYIADDGPGIPTADRKRVFESGYTTDADGTGFGLSIVKEIVEAHGWSIHLTDSATGGARFEVTTKS